jgi:hypothetical protein
MGEREEEGRDREERMKIAGHSRVLVQLVGTIGRWIGRAIPD